MCPSRIDDPASRAGRDVLVVRHEQDRVAGRVQAVEELQDLRAGAESRLPVGSSASRMPGRLTSARAIATRWRWPPESSFGRWSHAVREADAASSASRALRAARAARTPA